MKRSNQIWVALSLTVCAACNDAANGGIDKLPSTPDGGDGMEGDGGRDLASSPTFAVMLSDYSSAGVALLDGNGAVLSKKYISSGSAVPGLNSPLHGDIALPTQACSEGMLTVLARYGGDYLLQVDLQNGKVVRQVATDGVSGEGAYSSNPQDVTCLDDGQALVSRLEPNLTPGADPLDAGDDLLRIDLTKSKRLSRIDLSALRGKVGDDVAYARPGSIVRLGDRAIVGLSRQTSGFVADSGMLAIVKLDGGQVTGFAMPDFKNCGTLTPVAGRADAVLVSCAGEPYGDAASSGLLIVGLDERGKASVEHTFSGPTGQPVIYASPVSLGGTRALAVATGESAADGRPDVAFVIDLARGTATELFRSKHAFEVGSGAFRPDTGLLLVPDASLGVRTFLVEDEVAEGTPLELDPTLPPRAIAPLRSL